ncbi:MAG: SPASM domain-containing protein [Desulfobacterales bacterium]|nr:MAG: SPASM domain-containing protein [Desulfobacterales bacterium]
MQRAHANLKLPKHLYLETTSRCNLRCRGCILYRGSWEPQRDLSLKEFIMICEQLPTLERVALHGIGEPLLNPELPDMIQYLKQRKAFVFFNSNGILLDETYQYQLIDTGLDELRISLDAASPAGYKIMRDSDKFDLIISNVQAFSERIKSLHVSHPKLSFWYLGTQENISELPDFVRLAADLGIPEVYLQRLVYFQEDEGYGLAKPEKTLIDSNTAVTKWIHESHEIARQSGIQFNASGLSNPLESLQTNTLNSSPWKRCYRPITLMYITANGNVLPCCISPFATSDYDAIILGNVFDNSLAEIWSGHRYESFRKKRQTENPPKCCKGCGSLWSL